MPTTHHHEDHDRGLAFDVSTLLSRRRTLQLLGGVGLGALMGCSSSGEDAGTAASSSTAAAGTSGSTTTGSGEDCAVVPEETAGPFPGDGSNGVDVLSQSGVVRSDITSSFGTSTTTAAGVPLVMELSLLDSSSGCAPLGGAAVYVWHADGLGRYSMYSSGVEDENYLRGVQVSDADGRLRFTSIFPGAYPGRWPHVHFEVYASVEDATGGGRPLRTSQLAFPQDASEAVYATEGYDGSTANLAAMSIDTDMIFQDGYGDQMATMAGDASTGYTATLPVTV